MRCRTTYETYAAAAIGRYSPLRRCVAGSFYLAGTARPSSHPPLLIEGCVSLRPPCTCRGSACSARLIGRGPAGAGPPPARAAAAGRRVRRRMLLPASLVVVRAAAGFCRRGQPDAPAQALALARCAAGAVPFKAASTPNGPPLDAKPHTFGFVAGAAHGASRLLSTDLPKRRGSLLRHVDTALRHRAPPGGVHHARRAEAPGRGARVPRRDADWCALRARAVTHTRLMCARAACSC